MVVICHGWMVCVFTRSCRPDDRNGSIAVSGSKNTSLDGVFKASPKSPSSPKRDSNLDHPVLGSLAQHETSSLDNYTTKMHTFTLGYHRDGMLMDMREDVCCEEGGEIIHEVRLDLEYRRFDHTRCQRRLAIHEEGTDRPRGVVVSSPCYEPSSPRLDSRLVREETPQRFLGNESHKDHFKLLEKDQGSLLVGAR
uniref:Uncharacterized protein n=1 Tax=Timema douglasi TaxID=61478 RepID=A0A7R8VCC2_TIMDO|nr:unnamed protein product [Timema douglasi]